MSFFTGYANSNAKSEKSNFDLEVTAQHINEEKNYLKAKKDVKVVSVKDNNYKIGFIGTADFSGNIETVLKLLQLAGTYEDMFWPVNLDFSKKGILEEGATALAQAPNEKISHYVVKLFKVEIENGNFKQLTIRIESVKPEKGSPEEKLSQNSKGNNPLMDSMIGEIILNNIGILSIKFLYNRDFSLGDVDGIVSRSLKTALKFLLRLVHTPGVAKLNRELLFSVEMYKHEVYDYCHQSTFIIPRNLKQVKEQISSVDSCEYLHDSFTSNTNSIKFCSAVGDVYLAHYMIKTDRADAVSMALISKGTFDGGVGPLSGIAIFVELESKDENATTAVVKSAYSFRTLLPTFGKLFNMVADEQAAPGMKALAADIMCKLIFPVAKPAAQELLGNNNTASLPELTN